MIGRNAAIGLWRGREIADQRQVEFDAAARQAGEEKAAPVDAALVAPRSARQTASPCHWPAPRRQTRTLPNCWPGRSGRQWARAGAWYRGGSLAAPGPWAGRSSLGPGLRRLRRSGGNCRPRSKRDRPDWRAPCETARGSRRASLSRHDRSSGPESDRRNRLRLRCDGYRRLGHASAPRHPADRPAKIASPTWNSTSPNRACRARQCHRAGRDRSSAAHRCFLAPASSRRGGPPGRLPARPPVRRVRRAG